MVSDFGSFLIVFLYASESPEFWALEFYVEVFEDSMDACIVDVDAFFF